MTWNFHQNRSQKKKKKKQEQSVVPVAKWLLRVLACREKILPRPFRRCGCLHTHDIQRAREGFAPLQSIGASTSTTYSMQAFYGVQVCSHPRHTMCFIQLCCLFTLMFIHPNTPILVSTDINPSLTSSSYFIALPHKLLKLWGKTTSMGNFSPTMYGKG